MAKKTLEARLKMIDDTQGAQRTARRGAEETAAAYDKLDKAVGRAARTMAQARTRADSTLARQHIANLEREVDLGRKGAAQELQRVRITQQMRQERAALLRIAHSELTLHHQKVAAFRQLAQLERLHAAQLAGTQRGGMMGGFGGRMSGMMGLAGSYLGYQTVSGVFSRIEEIGSQRSDFHRGMTDLLGMGDNANNIDALNAKVLGLSAATGRAYSEIQQTLHFIDSGTAGIAKNVAEDIEKMTFKLGRMTSAEPVRWAEALIKSWRLFGDEVGSVQLLTDKLFKTAELGIMTYDQLATQIVQVLSAAESKGFKLDETLAAFASATVSARDPQVGGTALRNIILKMTDAEEKLGGKLQGDLISQMRQVSALDQDTLTDVFGVRNVTVLTAMNKNLEQQAEFINRVSDAAGELDDKYGKLATNAQRALAAMNDSAKRMAENALLMGGPGTMQTANDLELTKAFAKEKFPLMPEFMAEWGARASVAMGGTAAADMYIRMAQQRLTADDPDGAIAAAAEAARVLGGEDFTILNIRKQAEFMKRRRVEVREEDIAKRDAGNREAWRGMQERQAAAAYALSTNFGRATPRELLLIDEAARDESGAALQRVRQLGGHAFEAGLTNDQMFNLLQAGARAGMAAFHLASGAMALSGGTHVPLSSWKPPSRALTDELDRLGGAFTGDRDRRRETIQVTDVFQGLAAQQRHDRGIQGLIKAVNKQTAAIEVLQAVGQSISGFIAGMGVLDLKDVN